MQARMLAKVMLPTVIAGTLAVGARDSEAGQVITIPVQLYTDSSSGLRAAKGTLRDARNSEDSLAYIGCLRSSTADSNVLLCTARDGAGNFLMCSAWNTPLVDAINGMNASAQIRFQVASDGVTCAKVDVQVLSTFLP